MTWLLHVVPNSYTGKCHTTAQGLANTERRAFYPQAQSGICIVGRRTSERKIVCFRIVVLLLMKKTKVKVTDGVTSTMLHSTFHNLVENAACNVRQSAVGESRQIEVPYRSVEKRQPEQLFFCFAETAAARWRVWWQTVPDSSRLSEVPSHRQWNVALTVLAACCCRERRWRRAGASAVSWRLPARHRLALCRAHSQRQARTHNWNWIRSGTRNQWRHQLQPRYCKLSQITARTVDFADYTTARVSAENATHCATSRSTYAPTATLVTWTHHGDVGINVDSEVTDSILMCYQSEPVPPGAAAWASRYDITRVQNKENATSQRIELVHGSIISWNHAATWPDSI